MRINFDFRKVMLNTAKIIFVFLIAASTLQSFANEVTSASKDPNELLERLKKRFNSVKDYTADVQIKVKVEFLKIPLTKAKIYYKAPNKIKVDAKGFAMLPRSGLDFANTSMLQTKYDAIYIKEELVNKVNCSVVKVIPSEGGEVVISTMWIDPVRNELVKFITTTKSNGTFEVYLTYDKTKPAQIMPISLNIIFDVKKIQLPKSMSGDITGETARVEKTDKKKVTRGEIVLNYSNFVINKGLNDALFIEAKE